MEKDGDYFTYKYRPLSDEIVSPEILLTSEPQGMQTYRPNVRINYQKKKPDEQVEQVLEKMKQFYESENKDRFMTLFSSVYPDRVKFEEAIQNDFYNYKNMRLFYRIDSRTFDDDLEGAIWNVYWQRKYEDRNGNSLTDTTATIGMRFDKESGSWLITGLKNNTLFGSSLLVSVATAAQSDLTIAASDITLTDLGGYVTRIAAVIHNSGTAAASSVNVKYYKKCIDCPSPDANYVDISSDQTISSIAAGSSASAPNVNYSAAGPYEYSFKVEADSANAITESDETNNSATKSITLVP
jgi:hypothetical protein